METNKKFVLLGYVYLPWQDVALKLAKKKPARQVKASSWKIW